MAAKVSEAAGSTPTAAEFKALLDALKAVGIPAVEVHITDVDEREPFRKISYIRAACRKTISGHGTDGYLEAMDFLTGGC